MVNSSKDASELIGVLRNAALTTDADRLDEVADSFGEHLDHSQEVKNSTANFTMKFEWLERNIK